MVIGTQQQLDEAKRAKFGTAHPSDRMVLDWARSLFPEQNPWLRFKRITMSRVAKDGRGKPIYRLMKRTVLMGANDEILGNGSDTVEAVIEADVARQKKLPGTTPGINQNKETPMPDDTDTAAGAASTPNPIAAATATATAQTFTPAQIESIIEQAAEVIPQLYSEIGSLTQNVSALNEKVAAAVNSAQAGSTPALTNADLANINASVIRLNQALGQLPKNLPQIPGADPADTSSGAELGKQLAQQ